MKTTTPVRPAMDDLTAKLVGDWRATDGSRWQVSFTKAEGVIIINPQVWHLPTEVEGVEVAFFDETAHDRLP